MNAARRARQKGNRAEAGRHTVNDHWSFEGDRKIRCTVCRPLPTGKQPRTASIRISAALSSLLKLQQQAARSQSRSVPRRRRRR